MLKNFLNKFSKREQLDTDQIIITESSSNKKVRQARTFIFQYPLLALSLSGLLVIAILQKSLISEAVTLPASNVVYGRLEAESMTRPSGAYIINEGADPGQKAVVFTKNGTASGTVNLSANSNTINITARGTYCKNSWPTMTVKVDNSTVASNVKIDSNQWKDFIFAKTLNKGNHSVQISYTNDTSSCTRDLYVDSFEVSGPSSAPVVNLSASPATVSSGSVSKLTWSSTNAVSCVSSGGWTGTRPVSGTFNTSAISSTTIFTLTCTSSTGASASASTTVTVSNPTASSIYWGSWISGSTYGRTANGQGDAPWDLTTWDMFEANAGKKVSILHYGQPAMWDQAFAPNPANNVISNHDCSPNWFSLL